MVHLFVVPSIAFVQRSKVVPVSTPMILFTATNLDSPVGADVWVGSAVGTEVGDDEGASVVGAVVGSEVGADVGDNGGEL